MQGVKELVEILYEDAKDNMVNSTTDEEIRRYQGEARAYDRLLTQLTRPMGLQKD